MNWKSFLFGIKPTHGASRWVKTTGIIITALALIGFIVALSLIFAIGGAPAVITLWVFAGVLIIGLFLWMIGAIIYSAKETGDEKTELLMKLYGKGHYGHYHQPSLKGRLEVDYDNNPHSPRN